MPPSSTAPAQRRLRVLLIAPHFSEYTARLARALAAEVDLTVGFNHDNWRSEIETLPDEAGLLRGFHSFFFTTRRTVLRWLGAARVLWTLIRRRPDIVHFQETHNRILWLTEPMARRFAPVVLTIHDPVPHAGRDEAALEFWAQRVAMRRRAALCLAHGAHCLGVLATPEAGGIARAGNVRHGVVLQPGPEDLRAPEPRAILMFGRMEAYKGLEVLIAACERLQGEGVAFTLTLAGRGPEVDRLRPRIDALPQVRVKDGWLTPRDAIAEFQAASLVVMPYLESTQSGVLAAAFANGRPVVASDVGGIPDVLKDGETGVLVPPEDPAALAKVLAALLDDPARLERMGRAALDYADTRLAWTVIAAETATHYRTLVSGPPIRVD